MNTADFVALSPILVTAAAVVAVMLLSAFYRNHGVVMAATLLGLGAAFVALWAAAPLTPRPVGTLLIVDQYSLFYTGLILAATAAVVLLAYRYQQDRRVPPEELYTLLIMAALGAAVLTASTHFVSFFLGLEILSVALYALVAYAPRRLLLLEAGVKYLILAGASGAFLLFGMALLYAELGTMEFGRMAALLADGSHLNHALVLPGLALLVAGIGFKLAVAPFHMWTPDVYQGAPAPVTAFIATVSKGGMFALLLRYFYPAAIRDLHPVALLFSLVAIVSMIVGNLLALQQNNVKRILAYSSIAHLGYLLVAFRASGDMGISAATFYLVAYFVTTLGAFGIVTVLSGPERDADRLEDYRSLFWRRPALAGIFTAMLFSLAGIPLTAGFLGKFYIVAAGASEALWLLIFVLIISSAIGLFYYLRIIVTMYTRPEEGEPAGTIVAPPVWFGAGFALGALALLLVWLGVYPMPLLHWIEAATASLS